MQIDNIGRIQVPTKVVPLFKTTRGTLKMWSYTTINFKIKVRLNTEWHFGTKLCMVNEGSFKTRKQNLQANLRSTCQLYIKEK